MAGAAGTACRGPSCRESIWPCASQVQHHMRYPAVVGSGISACQLGHPTEPTKIPSVAPHHILYPHDPQRPSPSFPLLCGKQELEVGRSVDILLRRGSAWRRNEWDTETTRVWTPRRRPRRPSQGGSQSARPRDEQHSSECCLGRPAQLPDKLCAYTISSSVSSARPPGAPQPAAHPHNCV